jgi:hypothetical protein
MHPKSIDPKKVMARFPLASGCSTYFIKIAPSHAHYVQEYCRIQCDASTTAGNVILYTCLLGGRPFCAVPCMPTSPSFFCRPELKHLGRAPGYSNDWSDLLGIVR